MDIGRQLELAHRIAEEKHAGQTDKQGVPYIKHPRRVAQALTEPKLKIAALLHDTLEDTDTTAQELLDAGISEECVQMVCLLTRSKHTPYMDYIRQLRQHPDVIPIKLADLRDNLRPGCPAALRTRYEKAIALLSDPSAQV